MAMSGTTTSPRRDFGRYFWIHMALIIPAWLSPLLIPWLGIALLLPPYYLQFVLKGECVLTAAEFGKFKVDIGFYGHYCKYIGLGPYARQVDRYTHWFLPGGLAATGFLLQQAAGMQPLIPIKFLTFEYLRMSLI